MTNTLAKTALPILAVVASGCASAGTRSGYINAEHDYPWSTASYYAERECWNRAAGAASERSSVASCMEAKGWTYVERRTIGGLFGFGGAGGGLFLAACSVLSMAATMDSLAHWAASTTLMDSALTVGA